MTAGELEVDFTRNRVVFHPRAGKAFQLPLSPLDVEIAQQLSKYARTNQEHAKL